MSKERDRYGNEGQLPKVLEKLWSNYCSKFNIKDNGQYDGIDLLFANGRFHGLFPGSNPEDFYSGHPGIFYHLLIVALCKNIPFVRIIMSVKHDIGPKSKQPIPPDVKKFLITEIIELLKTKLPSNILSILRMLDDDNTIKPTIVTKISQIDIEVVPMNGSPIKTLNNIIEDVQHKLRKPIKMCMITGEEDGVNKYDKLWVNKYISAINPNGSNMKYILLPRPASAISGTQIRKSIFAQDYPALRALLDEAGFANTERRVFAMTAKQIDKTLTGISQPTQDFLDKLSNPSMINKSEVQVTEDDLTNLIEEDAVLGMYDDANDIQDDNKRDNIITRTEETLDQYAVLPDSQENGGKPSKRKTRRRRNKKTKKRRRSTKKGRRK